MDPPQCVQNAMMKQTKKPFTYTPGGIDLSEIKSPRMQRRIERNANYPGVGDIQQSNQLTPQAPTGPLPPSALAAMQPQIQVQVLPSGIPPSSLGSNKTGGAPPPPPPPPAYIPPPPPLQPLPTQKVCVNNETLERPDMTKIIPENPMALLKRTGGPKPRKSMVDEMLNVKPQQPPVQQPQPQYSPQPPPQQQYYQQPPLQPQTQPQPQWSPPQVQNEPRWPQPQSESQPQRWGQTQPQSEPPQNRWGTNGTVPTQSQPQATWSPPSQVQKAPPQPQPQTWSPPIIERQPPVEKPVKTSTAHIGSLYIPPVNQQQQQQRTATPPTPPKRDAQSPQIQSPTLKEAPKPWQKQTTSQEIPPWAKRDPPETVITQQQRNLESPPDSQKHPNAVYITQPIVLQHPGPPPQKQQQQRYQQQQQQQAAKVDAQGARVIPVKIENGQRQQTQPTTPGANERFSRQLSGGNTPIQSNSFKILQRLTNTDGDEEDDDGPVVEHPPKYPQQFQQTPPPLTEQLRKLQLSEGDRQLMNKVRQGVDDENSLHNEVDPRYRGAAIPSKAFKLLQSMTDGSDSSTVPRGSPSKTPQVRTIPIQIERDEPATAKPYVHPSEQTVPEPKKYTGSSIPSRSFKILQAMTADSCANANEVNENYDPYQWGCYEPYPYLYPPYPPYYYNTENVPEKTNECSCKTPAPTNDLRKTPLPWSVYYPPPVYETQQQEQENLRSKTPLMWGYYPYPVLPPPPPPPLPSKNNEDGGRITPVPVMYYPCYLMAPSPKDYEGYYAYPPPVWDPNWYYDENGVHHGTEEQAEPEENYKVASIIEKFEKKKKNEESPIKTIIKECSKKYEENEETHFNSLKAIKSVKDIRVYDNSDDEDDDDDDQNDEEVSSIITNDEISERTEDLDSIPHQLSIIYEESERSKRTTSVLSDSTTVLDEEEEQNNDDDEEEEENSITVSVKLGNGMNYKIDEEKVEIYTSFTLKSPSTTPKKDRSICRFEDNEDDKEEEKENISVIESDNNCQIKSEELQEPIENKEEEEREEEDWWSILKKDDDDFIYRRNVNKDTFSNQENEEDEDNKEKLNEDLKESSESDSNDGTLHNKESDLETDTTGKESDIESYQKHSDLLMKYQDERNEDKEESDNSTNKKAEIQENKKQYYEMQCSITNEANIEDEAQRNYKLFNVENKSETNTKTYFRRNSVKESVSVIEEMFQESPIQISRRNSNTPIPKSNQKTVTTDDDTSKSFKKIDTPRSFEKTIIPGVKTEILDDDDDTSSASSSDSSSSESNVSKKGILSSGKDNDFNNNNNEQEEKQPLTVKERIDALKASIQERQMRLKQKEDLNVSGVQNKITVFEKASSEKILEKTSNKSSIKSFEEYSEEEGDSGVTSDMSRHNISDEEFSELRKMNRYQRAATHSRLFKLLQEDDNEEEDVKNTTTTRRDQLSLPLNSDDSLSSSGLVSPVLPSTLINEKLINELVHSMLKRKKGQIFHDLPINKLEAAAKKVLLENIEVGMADISEDSFLSIGSTPAQTPQEFYNFSDYKPYYESWNIKDTKNKIQEQNKIVKYPNNKMSLNPSSKSPTPPETFNEVTSAS